VVESLGIDSAFRWLVPEADERHRWTMCSISLPGQSLGDDRSRAAAARVGIDNVLLARSTTFPVCSSQRCGTLRISDTS
jgi:hypothetical protein